MPTTPSDAQQRRVSAWLEKAARRRDGMPQPQVLVRAPGHRLYLARPHHRGSPRRELRYRAEQQHL
ncbi:hypothetical protein [Ornithinimicrobium sp. INDO-MA30-4]|uniref:hypothetical protein n=1 Tax=Ornithinimicrobium sp. INDO-MA30-4 TaxID=2908651 RepID=UPI001F44388A|nr:hypothetical protein [Ornithinimicrobium sp. INDO-MA30-4]UJH70371.1 hypothetical protein L0A91_14750 [Ornithinimicrobium sp. INDO-MA30-4]